MALDLNDPEVINAVKSAGFIPKDEVENLVTERNSALEANRNDILEQLNTTKQKYKGLDAEKYAQLAQDKRFGKILESGLDEYERGLGGELQERLRAQGSDFMIKEQSLLKQVEEKDRALEQLQQNLKASDIKRKLAIALSRNEMVDPLAIGEIERDALEELDLDEKGNIIVMGSDGIPKQTADGPMREDGWIKEMVSSKPYRFKGASGGNRQNVNGISGADLDKLTGPEKMALARKQRRA